MHKVPVTLCISYLKLISKLGLNLFSTKCNSRDSNLADFIPSTLKIPKKTTNNFSNVSRFPKNVSR